MSTKESSSDSKRRGGAPTVDDTGAGHEHEPKRLRRSVLPLDEEDPLLLQQRNEQMAELERQQKKLNEEIAEGDRKIADLERSRRHKQRLRDELEGRLARLKEQPAILQRQRRRRANPNKNARIENALHIYRTGAVPLDVLLELQFPDLIDSVEFWFAFFDDEDLKLDAKVYVFLFNHLPPSVFSNKALVLKIFSYDPKIYCALVPGDWQLKSDPHVVELVLELDPTLVDVVPGPAQRQNPNALGNALARLPLWLEGCAGYIQDCVDAEAWRHRDVVLGWVKGGGELHDEIPSELREDPNILLLAMGYMEPTTLQEPALPERICSNVDFMKKAVERNPRMLDYVADSLRGKMDVVLAALSGTHGYLATSSFFPAFFPDEQQLILDADEAETDPNEQEPIPDADEEETDPDEEQVTPDTEERIVILREHRLLIEVAESIRQQLCEHDVFVKLVLGSIHFSESKPSNLAVLDHGDEATLQARMKLIAEYVGVPIGKELGKLRRARMNLAKGEGIQW